jgi:hypothetical protein
MARKAAKARKKVDGRKNAKPWTSADKKSLRQHSKSKTPVAAISKTMKRTVAALRQQALKLGLPLGHRR